MMTNIHQRRAVALCIGLCALVWHSFVFAQDSDNDGLSDIDETSVYFTNPNNPDTDSDLISDGGEVTEYNTNPLDNDSDDDGITDGSEVYLSLSPFIIDDGSPMDVLYDGSRFLCLWKDSWGDKLMYTQFFDDRGAVSGQAFRPNASTGYDQIIGQIVFDGTNYYTMWTNYQAYYSTIEQEWHYRYYVSGQKFTENGTMIGDQDHITLHICTDDILSRHYAASMVYDGSDYVAAYTSSSLTETAIYKFFIEDDDRFEIGYFTFGDNMSEYGNVYTDIASSGSGHCIVWTSLGEEDWDSEIVARINNGSTFAVNAPDEAWQFIPHAASNGSTYLIVWMHHAGSHTELYARAYNTAGAPLSSPKFIINGTDIEGVTAVGDKYLLCFSSGGNDNAVLLSGTGDLIGSPFSIPGSRIAYNGTDCFLLSYGSMKVNGRIFDARILELMAERNMSFSDFSGTWRTDPNNADTDNDGISDGQELLDGTNPLTDDTDNDGLSDAQEPVYGTDFLNPDTDADELSDGDEVVVYGTNPVIADTDNDGLPDGNEILIYASDPINEDTDNDGLPDGDEANLYSSSPTVSDTDNDGLSDYQEVMVYGTNPVDTDSDNDELTDYEEVVTHQTNPLDSDTDNDGYTDYYEVNHGLNPANSDSDGDGIPDKKEDEIYFTDPRNTDSDNDGTIDGYEFDSDNDGLYDGSEWSVHFTDPFDRDTDSDTLSDGDEVNVYNTLPNSYDTDNDNVSDQIELLDSRINPLDNDTDDDGLLDGEESHNTYKNIHSINNSSVRHFLDSIYDGSDFVIVRSGPSERFLPDYSGEIRSSLLSFVKLNGNGQTLMSTVLDVQASSLNALDTIKIASAGADAGYYVIFEADNEAELDNEGEFVRNLYGLAVSPIFEPVGSPQKINEMDLPISFYLLDTAKYFSAQIVFDGTKYVVLFDRDDDLYAQYISPQGILQGGNLPLPGNTHYIYGLGSDGSDYLAVWKGSTYTKYARSTAVEAYELQTNGAFYAEPKQVVYGGNGYLVNFQDPTTCYFRFYDSAGQTLVNSFSFNMAWVRAIVYANGMFIAIWSSGDGLYAKLFTSDGAQLGSNVKLISWDSGEYPEYQYTLFSLSTDGQNLLLTWKRSYLSELQMTGTSSWTNEQVYYDNYARLVSLNSIYLDAMGVLYHDNPVDYHTLPDDPDTDNDGLLDGEEVHIYQSDPLDNDTDGDTLTDGQEAYQFFTSPILSDTDGDNLTDYEELFVHHTAPALADTDNDGVQDGLEVADGTNPANPDTDQEGLSDGQEKFDYQTDPLAPDTDNDGLTDYQEVVGYNTDPNNPDSDEDGLGDYEELIDYHTDPLNSDHDGDGVEDGAEVNTYYTNPLDNDSDDDTLSDGEEIFTYSTDPLNGDTDGDGLRDDQEIYVYQTDPVDSDTDKDALNDGEEVMTYLSDPLSQDTDADCITDHDELFRFATDLSDNDSDNDGIIDGYETFIMVPEFRVSVNSAQLPSAASDGQRFIVAWASESGYNSSDLSVRYISPEGEFDGDPFIISQHDPSWVWEGDIAFDGKNLLFAWRHFDWTNLGDFYGRILGDDGSFKTGNFMINTYTTGRQRDIRLASNGENFLAVWVDESRVDSYDVFAQFIDNDGNFIGSEFMVNEYTDYSQKSPVVVSDGEDYLVVWDGRSEIGGELFASDIVGRRVKGDATGSFLSGEFIINGINHDGYVVVEQQNTQERPSVVWNEILGMYYAVWLSSETSSKADICGRFINRDGTLEGAQQVVSEGTVQKEKPRVTNIGSNFFAVWETRLSPKDIYGRKVSYTGIPDGDVMKINSTGDSNENAVPASNGAEIIAVWARYVSGTGYDICGIVVSQELVQFIGTETGGWSKYRMNPNSTDTDNDSLDDYFEVYTSFTDPAVADIDNDGLNDYEEYQVHGTDPYSADKDEDKLIDSLEVAHGTNAYAGDTDNDGLSDYDELYEYGSDPLDNDSDNDGVIDGRELCLYVPEFRVNDYTADSQSLPRIAFNGNSYMLVWQGKSGGDSSGIMGSFTTSTGYAENADFIINTITANAQANPSVSSCAGTFLVTWDGYGTEDSNGVYGQLFNNAGVPVGSQFIVNTVTSNGQAYAQSESNGSNYLVVWQSDSPDASEYDIHARFTVSDGVPAGNEFIINQNTLYDQERPCAASVGGSYLVVWQSNVNGNYEICARLVSGDGTFLSDEFKVNTYTVNAQRYPEVVSDGESYLVLWDGYGAEDTAGIYGRFITSDGLFSGGQILINSYTGSTDSHPVAASNGAYYMVCWYSYNRPGDVLEGVYARFLDSSGFFYGNDIHINSYTDSNQNNPAVVSDGKQFMTAWTSSGQDGSSAGVYATVVTREFVHLIGTQPEIWAQYATEMHDPDSDNDSYSDYDEMYVHKTSPVLIDTDSDGLTDYDEIEAVYGYLTVAYDNDSDNDGLSDYIEVHTYLYGQSGNERTSPLDNDSDDDMLSDFDEIQTYFTDPKDPDPDNDGLIDSAEVLYGSNPYLPDTDNDGLNDYDEVYTWESNPADDDSDADGISDYDEVIHYHTKPYLSDTDNDGLSDLRELFIYLTPPSTADADNDGLKDGMELAVCIDDFVVNTYVVNQQMAPVAACNGNRYLAVWQSYLQDGSNYAVTGRYMGYNGRFLSNEFVINQYTINGQFHPVAASDGANFFVVWDGYGYSDTSGIHAVMLDNEGNYLTGQLAINETTSQTQEYPSIASNGDTYLIVWESYAHDGQYDGIFARVFDKQGNPVTGQIPVNQYTANNQQSPCAASDGTNYLVAWMSKDQDGSDNGIFARIFDNDGSPVTSEFSVNTYTAGTQKEPFTVSDGNTYLIAWDGAGQGDSLGIFAKVFDNEGNALTGDVVVNTYSTGTQSTVSASSDGDGYLLVWQSMGGDFQGNSYDLVGRFMNAEGTFGRAEFLVNSFTSGSQDTASVVSDGTGYFIFWETDNMDGNSTGIAASGITQDYAYVAGAKDQPWAEYRTNPFDSDTDTDGLNDYDEIYTWGSDPTNTDSDSDGLSDYDEAVYYNTDLLEADTDNDSVFDGMETTDGTNPNHPDTDEDGLTDGQEKFDYGTNPLLPDTDNDGLTDYDEIYTWGTDPVNGDSDSDGLFDNDELLYYHTDPFHADTDNDGLPDGDEVHTYQSSPLNPNTDGDALSDYEEVIAGTSPASSSSCFEVSQIGIDQQSGSISIGFSTIPGKYYRVYVDTGLTDGFVVLYDDIPAAGSVTAFADVGGGPNNIPHPSEETLMRIYKIVVKQ